MDRGVFGERRVGHADEQLALDGRQIVDGHHRATAVRGMSAGRRQVQDRATIHIHSSGVLVVLGFGYVSKFIFLKYLLICCCIW